MGHEDKKIIDHFRKEISAIDREIFSLVKRREKLSSEIGRIKRNLSIPDRDFSREKVVFENAIALAKELELSESFAIALQELIIEASLSRQEQDRIRDSFHDAKKSVLIVGGAGRLGKWFCRFFLDSGHRVSVVDLQDPGFSCDFSTSIDKNANDHDVIVIATPIRTSIEMLDQIFSLNLKHPVIFDVSSVKTPVHSSLLKLKKHGFNVTSLHPMFGPSVNLLFGKHIIRTSLGVKIADDLVNNIFRITSLQVVDMSIDEHDAVISVLLSLAHLINIVFINALAMGDFPINYLEKFSSPTFSNLLAVARKVMSENPRLYFEIQALNPHSKNAHQKLAQALHLVMESISSFDEEKFVTLMQSGEQYLAGKS